MLSMLDIWIGLNFEKDMGNHLKSHSNGMGSLVVLEIDLNFGQWIYVLFYFDLSISGRVDHSMNQKW